jgi:hypothetical protein
MIGVVSHFENRMARSLGNMRTLYMSDVEFFFLTLFLYFSYMRLICRLPKFTKRNNQITTEHYRIIESNLLEWHQILTLK